MTQERCAAAKYTAEGNRRQVIWDTELHGLGLRIFPSGAKAFILSYRNPETRKARLYTLGAYGVLSVTKARKAAQKELVRIAEGHDPLDAKAEAMVPVMTFKELAEKWLTDYAEPHRKSVKEDRRRAEKHLIPALGALAVTKVTRAQVRRIHAAIGKSSPVEANRVANLIRAMYAKGQTWGIVPDSHPNPGRGLDRFREHSRTRWLTEREMQRLLRAVDREEPEIKAIVRLLLLTGMRKSEVLSLRWDALDLDAGKVRLRKTKTGVERVVPLSPAAVAVIRDLPRRLGSPYLFPSPRAKNGSAPLRDIKRDWERIRRRARLHDVKIHDLRRTTGSALVNAGVPLETIASALGHTDSRTTKIYARIAQEQASAALDTLGTAIAALDRDRKHARGA